MSGGFDNDGSGAINLPQVNAQLPRKVRFDSTSIKALTIGTLIFLSGIAVLAWLSLDTAKNLYVQSTLLREGRLANGTITASSVNRGGTNVKYTFTVDSVQHSGQAEMKADHYSTPGNARLLAIRYLPADPRVNQPVNWQWTSAWDFFPFLLLIAMTAVGGNTLITAIKLTRLARSGIVVSGRVTGCTPNKKLFRIFYVFTSEAKEETEGSCGLLTEYEVGASIPIIYLPTSPERNTKYPIAGYLFPE